MIFRKLNMWNESIGPRLHLQILLWKAVYVFLIMCHISNMLKMHNSFKSYTMIHAAPFSYVFSRHFQCNAICLHPTTFTPSNHDLKFSMFLWSYQNNLKTNWKLQSTSLSQLMKFQSCFLRILKLLHSFHTWEFQKHSHLKHIKCFETWLGWTFWSQHTKTSKFFTFERHKMFWNMAGPNIMKLTCQNSKVFHIWNMAWSKFLKHCKISSLFSKHWKALK